MHAKAGKEKKFKRRLKAVLERENLGQQRMLIKQFMAETDWSLEDCAAALVFVSQPNLYPSAKKTEQIPDRKKNSDLPTLERKYKTVRYRLDLGSKHQVEQHEIENVLVEEAGVERSRISRVTIRHHYTIVELPEGMPSDIFQLLTDVEIRQQKLKIKRLKPQRKYRSYRHQTNG